MKIENILKSSNTNKYEDNSSYFVENTDLPNVPSVNIAIHNVK